VLFSRLQIKVNASLIILAGLMLLFLISLGQWQIRRAEQKQTLLDMQLARMDLPARLIEELDFEKNQLRYLPVRVIGDVDARHQILIDNQVRHGRVGYFVLTPIKLSNNTAVLLNRGWVAQSEDRSRLPMVETKLSFLSSQGRLDHFPVVAIELEGADQLSTGWPAVTQIINLDQVAEKLGYKVLPYQVLMDEQQEHGYDREWFLMKMGPDRHYGYAFQWFSLAVAWVILCFLVSLKRGENNEYINKKST